MRTTPLFARRTRSTPCAVSTSTSPTRSDRKCTAALAIACRSGWSSLRRASASGVPPAATTRPATSPSSHLRGGASSGRSSTYSVPSAFAPRPGRARSPEIAAILGACAYVPRPEEFYAEGDLAWLASWRAESGVGALPVEGAVSLSGAVNHDDLQADGALEQAEVHAALFRALAELETRTRTLIEAVYFRGQSIAEGSGGLTRSWASRLHTDAITSLKRAMLRAGYRDRFAEGALPPLVSRPKAPAEGEPEAPSTCRGEEGAGRRCVPRRSSRRADRSRRRTRAASCNAVPWSGRGRRDPFQGDLRATRGEPRAGGRDHRLPRASHARTLARPPRAPGDRVVDRAAVLRAPPNDGPLRGARY